MRLINMAGQRFFRWTVTEKREASKWLCECDCGNTALVAAWTLRAGKSRSCGCLGFEETKSRLTQHGLTKHPMFNIWKGMKSRCYNKNNKSYKYYGVRGIKICDRWLKSFQNFYDDMVHSYENGLTIERIDNNRDYEPGNCTWIPRPDQSRNRRPSSEWDFKRGSRPLNKRRLFSKVGNS